MLNYGEAIKYQRDQNNKTLTDIEKATGINNGNLSRWERGEVLPNIDFCVRLADYFGITLDELVGREKIEQKMTPHLRLNKKEEKTIQLFRNLSISDQDIISALLQSLNKEEK